MGNMSVAIKKFLSNKNTVTVLGVVIGIIVLYVGYNIRVNNKLNPIAVPYATKTIKPRTKIDSEMIGIMNVPRDMIRGDVITDQAQVVGKYVINDSVVPEGSLFYTRCVVPKDQLPDSVLLEYPEGYSLYNMQVTMESTYSNMIMPQNYIDVYVKITNNIDKDATSPIEDKIMVGKLLQNVKVLAVRDASGADVFEDLEDKKTPSLIIFAIPEEYHILLRKAEYLNTYSAELIPVPTNASLQANPDEVSISSNEIKDFINRVTVWTESTVTQTQ